MKRYRVEFMFRTDAGDWRVDTLENNGELFTEEEANRLALELSSRDNIKWAKAVDMQVELILEFPELGKKLWMYDLLDNKTDQWTFKFNAKAADGVTYEIWQNDRTGEMTWDYIEDDYEYSDYEYEEAFKLSDEYYTPSATAGDYSPSHPWDAPGMSISDFI